MSRATFTLITGLTVGEQVHKEVTIRELTAGDVFDAQSDAEQLVSTPEGPQLVASPSAVGIHTLRRQIVRIGDIDGPLAMKELRMLDAIDLEMIQSECVKLEQASMASIASREVTRRGRADEGSG